MIIPTNLTTLAYYKNCGREPTYRASPTLRLFLLWQVVFSYRVATHYLLDKHVPHFLLEFGPAALDFHSVSWTKSAKTPVIMRLFGLCLIITRSSIRLTIPVAFICNSPLICNFLCNILHRKQTKIQRTVWNFKTIKNYEITLYNINDL